MPRASGTALTSKPSPLRYFTSRSRKRWSSSTTRMRVLSSAIGELTREAIDCYKNWVTRHPCKEGSRYHASSMKKALVLLLTLTLASASAFAQQRGDREPRGGGKNQGMSKDQRERM